MEKFRGRIDKGERKIIDEFFETIIAELREGLDVKDPFGISKNFYSGIGLIAAEWARAEELVGFLCFLVFDIEPPTGVPLIANLGYRSRVQVLHSIADATITRAEEFFGADNKDAQALVERSKEIKKALADLDELYPKRNAYVHCFYTAGFGEDGAHIFAARAKGKLKYETGSVTFDELWDVYLQIHRARDKLSKLVRAYDVEGYFHEVPREGDASPESEGTPSPDPTSSGPPNPPLRSQAKERPRRVRKKLSSAQKRALRERGETP